MSRFIVLVDGRLWGYDNPEILLCHLAENKPEKYQIFQSVKGWKESWKPISKLEVKQCTMTDYLNLNKNTEGPQ